jgi:hypothetical protein
MGEACGTYVRQEGCKQGLVVRSKERRPLGRRKLRWEDNIKMHIQEGGWGDMDWIYLVQVRDRWHVLVNAVINLWVP